MTCKTSPDNKPQFYFNIGTFVSSFLRFMTVYEENKYYEAHKDLFIRLLFYSQRVVLLIEVLPFRGNVFHPGVIFTQLRFSCTE